MKFGLDLTTGEKIEPKRGLISKCPCCDSELIAKCGDINIHHWAHKIGPHCDPWWEPETEWHRNWKNKFPKDWQETRKIDATTGERHVADVYNPEMDLVIEFQNSPIDSKELESREHFYKKMVWLVNARKFQFYTSPLYEWNEDVDDLEKKFIRDIFKVNRKLSHVLEVKRINLKSESRKIQKALNTGELTDEKGKHKKWQIRIEWAKTMMTFYSKSKSPLASDLRKYYQSLVNYQKKNEGKGFEEHFIQYTWIRRRKVWDKARLPVFFDVGNELVWINSQFIAKKVPVDKFIKKYGS